MKYELVDSFMIADALRGAGMQPTQITNVKGQQRQYVVAFLLPYEEWHEDETIPQLVFEAFSSDVELVQCWRSVHVKTQAHRPSVCAIAFIAVLQVTKGE